jgi:hypothetical protein
VCREDPKVDGFQQDGIGHRSNRPRTNGNALSSAFSESSDNVTEAKVAGLSDLNELPIAEFSDLRELGDIGSSKKIKSGFFIES